MTVKNLVGLVLTSLPCRQNEMVANLPDSDCYCPLGVWSVTLDFCGSGSGQPTK